MARLAHRNSSGRQALFNIVKRLRDPSTAPAAADALESVDCELFLREYEQAYADLRKDPKEWAEVQAERREWDGTLMDGLEEA
jgi:hypothetical protein